jgi:signal transduction histidine kinase
MSLSQYILNARDNARIEMRLHNLWLVHLRWVYIIVFGIVVFTSSNLAENSMDLRTFVVKLCFSSLAINCGFWLLAHAHNRSTLYYQLIAIGQVIFDVTLASFVIYFLGGLESRAIILYALPIIGKGLLFEGSVAYLAPFLSSIAYAVTLWYHQVRHPFAYEVEAIVQPVIFYTCVFFVLAVMISRFTARTNARQREKSYSELLALLRHQLYHPSGVIAAIIDMLQHGEHYAHWPAGDKVYLQQLKRENKKLHTMVSNMLETVTPDKKLKRTEVFDIVPLLNDEAISCATGAKRLADLKTMLPNKTIEVEGDVQQLTVALDNILENAFRYTEKGTQVIVSATDENYKVTISIHDKGKGISEAEQKILFNLFSQFEGRTAAASDKLYDTGLGLYVSKLIIERHKGKLELSSSAEYGTNITITLFGRLI